uniref:Ribonuclease H-like domain-containing protein n=1 Tax=Tanacetum cinerariifolium TaxID=118510 RepID=A0A6L2KU21_TANCI|nr:ribonuclease H-like domain-containing protein [Tanacetum cinerariifolium]
MLLSPRYAGFGDQQEMLLIISPKTVDHTCLKDLTILIFMADSSQQWLGSIRETNSLILCAGTGKLDFENVYFVKELKFNLFSVSQMCDKKNSVLFTETECLVLSPDFKLPDENQVLLKVPRQNNMYSFNLKNVVPSENRVLVTKPHNKTLYKLLIGRTPNLDFIKPFRFHVTILNTFDHLGKFKGKVDEGFLVGYFINSKEFRVLNSRTKRVKENLHINMPSLEETGIFDDVYNDREVGAEADTNNFELSTVVSPIPTTRVHKDHPKEQIIRDLNLSTQTRRVLDFSEENVMMDVKSTFLYVIIEEEVYVCQPPGFEDPHFLNKVYKVEKSLYGLHKAPRACYEPLSTYLLENKFRKGTIDKKLFIKKDRDDILLVQVYVDDIIFGSVKKSLCDEFEQIMHKRFQMSSKGELTFFLGLQVKQKYDGIYISQDKYMADILKKFYFTIVKTASTPMEPKRTLIKDAEAKDTATVKVVDNEEQQIIATVDSKEFTITEASVRRHLQLADADDEAVYEEWDDSVERATTTAASLDATQDSGGSIAQNRSERVPTSPHYSPFPRVNTLGSDEGSMLLQELTALCTTLSDRVLALETDLRQTKKVYGTAYTKLIMKVKKMEKTLGVFSAAKVLADATKKKVNTYIRRRRAVTTGSEGVSTASRIFSTAKKSVSTTGESIPVSTTNVVQEGVKDKAQKLYEEEQARFNAEPKATFNAEQEELLASETTKDVANPSVIDVDWDDVQAQIQADEELAQKMLEEEGKSLSITKRAKLLIDLIDKRKKLQTFDDMLKRFDRDDLVRLWDLVKEMFNTTEPIDDKEKALWVELKRLFEPDNDDILWKL